MDTIKTFLSKNRTLFPIFKKCRGGLPSLHQFRACECGWICINISEYLWIILWKSLNKLFWLCQGSEYARSSYMFDRLLKMPRVLNKPGFCIWHGCISKGYAEFGIWLHTPQLCPNIPEFTLLSLNSPENNWIFLNFTEYVWKCLNKLLWLCQGSPYAKI